MAQENQAYTMATPAGVITIAQARPGDVDALVAIEEDAAQWVRSRGFEPGVPPRPLRDIYTDRANRGEVYLARLEGQPAAMLTLQWADSSTWGDVPDDAAYVHGLMVRRAYAGKQVGLNLLRWAERTAAASGRTYLRLDCKADNPALRAYYERAGYVYRGEVRLQSYTGAKYEKCVAGDG
jgi:GNAT superfamily N-acetyltransferase